MAGNREAVGRVFSLLGCTVRGTRSVTAEDGRPVRSLISDRVVEVASDGVGWILPGHPTERTGEQLTFDPYDAAELRAILKHRVDRMFADKACDLSEMWISQVVICPSLIPNPPRIL
ncbi:hypothetical protein EI982_08520 [Haloplanus rallus]|uniref:Uncharacterized protein n=1 Tax=Haloplanus rallus TaxID=1816183 RepID=A0A6B9F9B5_9EURY|nr:hypothetical protein [Haloplanus rallus]QGX94831.1 hypothetical protein EI982_08520 [Haloplanus rallus]